TSFHFQLPPPPPLSSFKRSHHHPDLHSFPTRRSSDLIPASLQHRHLDGEIAQSRRLRRAKQYLQPGPLRRQAIQQRVLASPTDKIGRHTSELQSRGHLVCRLLLEKKKTKFTYQSMIQI